MATYANVRPATRPAVGQAGSLSLTRAHRVLLYAAALLWFAVFVRLQQRNYQDAWILDGIFIPFAVYVAAFLLAVIPERDNRVVALLAASAACMLAMVPALKYVQPYGVAIDATVHFLATQTIYNTGHGIDPADVYASIPAMHSWLASLALMGGFSPATAIKVGLPLMSGAYPLLVYYISRAARLPAGPTRYAVCLAVLTAFPEYVPSGSGFSAQTLVLILAVLLLRDFYTVSTRARVIYSALALILLAQLIVWHSTTPLMLPLALAGVAFMPMAVKLAYRPAGAWRVHMPFLRFAVLAGVAYVAYHVLTDDQVYRVMTTTAYKLITHQDTVANVVPQRAFQITVFDLLRVLLVAQGRDAIMLALFALGVILIWRNRARWANLLPFYVYLTIVSVLFLIGMVGALTGLDYDRFLMVPVVLSPFFGGVALWWLEQRLLVRPLRRRTLTQATWGLTLLLIIGFWVPSFYIMQPLIPKAREIRTNLRSEYVVWFHSVNTAYQQRMLNFAETRTNPASRFALDLTTQRQFWRYFGLDAGIRRGLSLPLHWQVTLDDRVKYYLLHWPGVSGPWGEQVEDRSTTKITELRNTPGWSLVYDNGQSFILKVR